MLGFAVEVVKAKVVDEEDGMNDLIDVVYCYKNRVPLSGEP